MSTTIPRYQYIISRRLDPVFALFIGTSAAFVRIRREEREKMSSTDGVAGGVVGGLGGEVGATEGGVSGMDIFLTGWRRLRFVTGFEDLGRPRGEVEGRV